MLLAYGTVMVCRRYVEVNSGNDHRIKTCVGLHPINPEECDVYTSLLDVCASGVVTPCVNHTLADDGDIEGFRFTCDANERANCLPVNRKMFFRTSMVECNTSDPRVKCGYNNTALEMLLKHEQVQSKLLGVVQALHRKSIGSEASFECMPDNLDQIHTSSEVVNRGGSEPLLGSFMCRRAADCKDWSPEMPEYVGIFHAYTRGFNQDHREHKLFIITSGGCNALCDTYFNMCLDIDAV